ncbi:flagellar hook-length control protein FliK [Flavisphingopyxis soli]|nr:flagellar hook-length control protein FliK [Sphingorhabdus soli]
MTGNTLPFRRQLEAKTAPHLAPTTASSLPGHAKFAVASPVGEDTNPLAVETGAADKADAAKSDDKRDTDANPNVMAPMIVLPGVATPQVLAAVPATGAALTQTTGAAGDSLQSGSHGAARTAPGVVARGTIDLPAPASDVAKAATAAAASANSTPATPAGPATVASTAAPVTPAPTPSAIQSSAAARSEQATSAQLQNDQAARTAVTQTLPTAASAVGAAQFIQAGGIAGRAGATPTREAQGSKASAAKIGDSETSATSRAPATNLAAALQRSIGDKPAPAHSNAPVAAAPAPVLAADTSAQPVQNFTQVVAQQTAPAQAGTPTPQNLPTAATVPFDHNFGQRIGGAISAAMSAMSIKNGAILLQITPEGFGKLEIALDHKMERLQITTENEAVRGAIAQAHGRIEHELRQAGQRITTIDVATRDAAARHDGSGSEQRSGQSAGHSTGHDGRGSNAQQSASTRHDQRGFSANHGIPARPESGLSNPASNVFYA